MQASRHGSSHPILFIITFLCSLLSGTTVLLGFPLICHVQLCTGCFVCLETSLPRNAPGSPSLLSYRSSSQRILPWLPRRKQPLPTPTSVLLIILSYLFFYSIYHHLKQVFFVYCLSPPLECKLPREQEPWSRSFTVVLHYLEECLAPRGHSINSQRINWHAALFLTSFCTLTNVQII